MQRILVVDDEPEITDFLSQGLNYKGFEVLIADCGEEALVTSRKWQPDLVVLDVMLPDMNGYDVCRALRAAGQKSLPILLLTAKDSLPAKIDGLDSGADDYITKPFAFEELLARIRANLRRVRDLNRDSQQIKLGDLTLEPASRLAWRDGELLDFTRQEYDLLELLVRHAGQVLTKEQIFEQVWGYDHDGGQEVIKVYINYLRSKLNAGGKVDLIHTVRGLGYTLKPHHPNK